MPPPAAVGSPAGVKWQTDKQMVGRSTLRTVQGKRKGCVEVCMRRQATCKLSCVMFEPLHKFAKLVASSGSRLKRERPWTSGGPVRSKKGEPRGQNDPPLKERRGVQSSPPSGEGAGAHLPPQPSGSLGAFGETLCPERWARAMGAADRQTYRERQAASLETEKFGPDAAALHLETLLSAASELPAQRHLKWLPMRYWMREYISQGGARAITEG